jgi:hypothetical protein
VEKIAKKGRRLKGRGNREVRGMKVRGMGN